MSSAAISTMQLVADDPVNRSIWTDSVALQREIVERSTRPLQAGAQQVMPKASDEGYFSARDPLPWVPDLVGTDFGNDTKSVLVVASSYNGFIRDYSGRGAVMPLGDYVDAKKAGVDGLRRFITKFKESVVNRDEDYYQPILRDLLSASGCAMENCCLTDLCKASFVQRCEGSDGGNRGDKGSDKVLQTFWSQWIPYVIGVDHGERNVPLPYQWLWQRMQQCRVIVALGTIAEYGVLKIFQHMGGEPKAWSWKEANVSPDHPTLSAKSPAWEYAYACSRRRLGSWADNEDWWVLSDAGARPRWFMLPVYHPTGAFVYKHDLGYARTLPRLRRMIQEAASKLCG